MKQESGIRNHLFANTNQVQDYKVYMLTYTHATHHAYTDIYNDNIVRDKMQPYITITHIFMSSRTGTGAPHRGSNPPVHIEFNEDFHCKSGEMANRPPEGCAPVLQYVLN